MALAMGILSPLEIVLPTAGSCLSKWWGPVNIASVFSDRADRSRRQRQLGLEVLIHRLHVVSNMNRIRRGNLLRKRLAAEQKEGDGTFHKSMRNTRSHLPTPPASDTPDLYSCAPSHPPFHASTSSILPPFHPSILPLQRFVRPDRQCIAVEPYFDRNILFTG
jgi:hypothetical protein